MLKPTELVPTSSVNNGNKAAKPKEPIRFLTLHRQFFDKEVEHQLMAPETQERLKQRQNEIINELRELKELQQNEEDNDDRSTKKKKKKSLKSTK